MKLNYFKFKAKQNNREQGFTIIELLVVMLIMGVLSVMSLPTLLANVGKSRETEATINLGTLSRAQQNYHLENQQFATTIADLNSTVALTSKYYDFPDPGIASNTLVRHQATATSVRARQVRNYASGIYYEPSSGASAIVICQAQGVGFAVDAPNTVIDNCTNGGRKIK